jgi:hypothetical protein
MNLLNSYTIHTAWYRVHQVHSSVRQVLHQTSVSTTEGALRAAVLSGSALCVCYSIPNPIPPIKDVKIDDGFDGLLLHPHIDALYVINMGMIIENIF